MQVVINGEEQTLPAEMTLSALIDHLGIDRRLIAAAHNGEVVKRDTYESVEVRDGDRIEIVRMVGGG